ncbi:MAG: PspA/IM30 family protein [Armatimonadetes bacterium]|nr:PspA/IM30 family protein [Armatimonadota bacterium]
MGLLRDLQAALREGLDELLNANAQRDEVEEVTSLLETDVNEARSELSLAIADEKRLRARIDQENRDADRYREQAQASVDKGDDEAARDYIKRRRRSLRGVEILEQQFAEHQQLITMLSDHVEELEDKLQEVRLKRDFVRTRGRVRALKERYERYRRDFGLDPMPLGEEFELGGPGAPALPLGPGPDGPADALPEEFEAEPRAPRASRRAPGEEPSAETAPEPLSGLGEVPRPEAHDEPVLRRRNGHEPEPDEPAPWDRPPRDMRQMREHLLNQIERKQRSAEFEAALDAELAQMKGGTASPPPAEAEPARRPEPAVQGPRPTAEDEDEDEAADDRADQPGAGA